MVTKQTGIELLIPARIAPQPRGEEETDRITAAATFYLIQHTVSIVACSGEGAVHSLEALPQTLWSGGWWRRSRPRAPTGGGVHVALWAESEGLRQHGSNADEGTSSLTESAAVRARHRG